MAASNPSYREAKFRAPTGNRRNLLEACRQSRREAVRGPFGSGPRNSESAPQGPDRCPLKRRLGGPRSEILGRWYARQAVSRNRAGIDHVTVRFYGGLKGPAVHSGFDRVFASARLPSHRSPLTPGEQIGKLEVRIFIGRYDALRTIVFDLSFEPPRDSYLAVGADLSLREREAVKHLFVPELILELIPRRVRIGLTKGTKDGRLVRGSGDALQVPVPARARLRRMARSAFTNSGSCPWNQSSSLRRSATPSGDSPAPASTSFQYSSRWR